MDVNKLKEKAEQIRRNVIEILRPNESHHIGCSLDIVEILTSLYFEIMNVNSNNPKDLDRDIFILSKGHAAAALYATLFERGFFDRKLLETYDQDGTTLPEHANIKVPGVELSTGSLGHGLPVGNGFALSFRNDKKKNRVYVLMSDGELNEGSNWEAIMFAPFHKLNNLTVIIDSNKFQGYGEVSKILNLEPLRNKFESFGWKVLEIDGHNFGQLNKAFEECKRELEKPQIIIANTIKGKGVKFFEGKFESHYQSISEEMKRKILEELI